MRTCRRGIEDKALEDPPLHFSFFQTRTVVKIRTDSRLPRLLPFGNVCRLPDPPKVVTYEFDACTEEFFTCGLSKLTPQILKKCALQRSQPCSRLRNDRTTISWSRYLGSYMDRTVPVCRTCHRCVNHCCSISWSYHFGKPICEVTFNTCVGKWARSGETTKFKFSN